MKKANQGVSQQPTAQWAMKKTNATAGAEGKTERAAHVSGVEGMCALWQAGMTEMQGRTSSAERQGRT
eukprot:4097408-Pleurochrysis_carterae.AAC.1